MDAKLSRWKDNCFPRQHVLRLGTICIEPYNKAAYARRYTNTKQTDWAWLQTVSSVNMTRLHQISTLSWFRSNITKLLTCMSGTDCHAIVSCEDCVRVTLWYREFTDGLSAWVSVISFWRTTGYRSSLPVIGRDRDRPRHVSDDDSRERHAAALQWSGHHEGLPTASGNLNRHAVIHTLAMSIESHPEQTQLQFNEPNKNRNKSPPNHNRSKYESLACLLASNTKLYSPILYVFSVT